MRLGTFCLVALFSTVTLAEKTAADFPVFDDAFSVQTSLTRREPVEADMVILYEGSLKRQVREMIAYLEESGANPKARSLTGAKAGLESLRANLKAVENARFRPGNKDADGKTLAVRIESLADAYRGFVSAQRDSVQRSRLGSGWAPSGTLDYGEVRKPSQESIPALSSPGFAREVARSTTPGPDDDQRGSAHWEFAIKASISTKSEPTDQSAALLHCAALACRDCTVFGAGPDGIAFVNQNSEINLVVPDGKDSVTQVIYSAAVNKTLGANAPVALKYEPPGSVARYFRVEPIKHLRAENRHYPTPRNIFTVAMGNAPDPSLKPEQYAGPEKIQPLNQPAMMTIYAEVEKAMNPSPIYDPLIRARALRVLRACLKVDKFQNRIRADLNSRYRNGLGGAPRAHGANAAKDHI